MNRRTWLRHAIGMTGTLAAAVPRAAARAQLQISFKRSGKPAIDLIQVHNTGNIRTQLPILREYKDKGRVRYIGVTTTFDSQYDELVEAMRSERPDFIGMPATSRPKNMADNMSSAMGRLPDAAMRRRMIELVESLPA